MKHPLEFMAPERRKSAFVLFLLLSTLLLAALQVLDLPLRTQAAPGGMVSFELAGTPARAGRILASWGALNEQAGVSVFQPARTAAAFGLGLDFLFMPVYGIAVSLGILLAGGKAPWMGWTPFLAAAFDAVENYALLQLLMGSMISPWPQLAAACAALKFALLACAILYALLARGVMKPQSEAA
jgi:hypothetical protein